MTSTHYLLPLSRTTRRYIRRTIGDAGEAWCSKHLICPGCNKGPNWRNLNDMNRNFPGIDLACMNCVYVAQIKTGVASLSKSKEGYRIPSSPFTTRATLTTFANRIVYVYIQYKPVTFEIASVRITDPLTIYNLDETTTHVIAPMSELDLYDVQSPPDEEDNDLFTHTGFYVCIVAAYVCFLFAMAMIYSR